MWDQRISYGKEQVYIRPALPTRALYKFLHTPLSKFYSYYCVVEKPTPLGSAVPRSRIIVLQLCHEHLATACPSFLLTCMRNWTTDLRTSLNGFAVVIVVIFGEWRYSSTHSLTSALDGGEWSVSRPGRFTPRERTPCTHCNGGWVGPRAGLDALVKRKIPSPAGNRTLEPQSVVVIISSSSSSSSSWSFLIGEPG
jgi:hypothetical protein